VEWDGGPGAQLDSAENPEGLPQAGAAGRRGRARPRPRRRGLAASQTIRSTAGPRSKTGMPAGHRV